MALTRVQYEADGSTSVYSITFPYLSSGDVVVSVDGQEVGFSFLDGSSVSLNTPPTAGSIVDIRRRTNRNSLMVDFHDGSTLLETDLNLAAEQSFYLMQETLDDQDQNLSVDPDGTYKAQDRRITNLRYPEAQTDSANKQYVDDVYAAGNDIFEERTKAEAAATAAGNHADAASTSASQAQQFRDEGATIRDEIEQLDTSASQSAAAASNSATTAQNAATSASADADQVALDAEDSAASSQIAQNAEDTTLGYRNEAETFRNEAQTAATGASDSETAALSAKNAANNFADQAASSAGSASNDATRAENAADDAQKAAQGGVIPYHTPTAVDQVLDLDVSQGKAFVIDNTVPLKVNLVGTEAGEAAKVYVLLQGQEVVEFNDNRVIWTGDLDNAEFAQPNTVLILTYFPQVGWHATAETLDLFAPIEFPTTSEPENLLPSAYVGNVDDTEWLRASGDDGSGNGKWTTGFLTQDMLPYASEVEIDSAENRHVWYDMEEALATNAVYVLSVEAKLGRNGWTGPFQIAYYDDSTTLNEIEPIPTEDWTTHKAVFHAGEATVLPRIRLIGWGEGAIGDTLRLGKVRLEHLAEPEPDNLLPVDYVLDDSDWFNSDDGTTVEFAQDDENGDPLAAKVTMEDIESQHVWHNLPAELARGNLFRIEARVAPGPEGFTGNFQVAYYDGGSNMGGNEVALVDGWQTVVGEFTAEAALNEDPSIRLIGFSDAQVGESVLIQKVTLTDITNEGA